MESKKIISALAMAAVMVGCSQEEIVTQSNLVVSGSLEERPVIGNIDLGSGDVESRMAIKDNHGFNVKYEVGDQVGAAIIDEPILDEEIEGEGNYSGLSWSYADYLQNLNKGTEETPVYYTTAGISAKDFYNTVEYISTNYPYTRAESGKFETQANLVEGNYFFYMPYNAAHLNRTRINAVLPQVQDCSDDVMKNATYGTGTVSSSSTVIDQFYKGKVEGAENAPVLVGYKFLEAPKDGSIIEPSVPLTHLYAYPMITIKNDFNGLLFKTKNSDVTANTKYKVAMTVDSIHIYHDVEEGNLLFHKAAISSSALASVLENDGEWDSVRLTTGAPTTDILDGNKTSTLAQTVTYAPESPVAAEAVLNKENRVTCVVDKELENGESYSFRAILPAGNYEHNLKARIYVTIGEEQYVLATATTTPVDYENGAYVNMKANAVTPDFTFIDDVNGGMDCELVRGQQYPKAEIREDGTALKSFAGSMMTISMANASAFKLKEAPIVAPVVDNGILTNTELINYLKDNVQRGVVINEYAALRTVAKTSWKTQDPDGAEGDATANAGNLAFAENNAIIINAALISDLKQQTIVSSDTEIKLVLNNAVLPIANDVKIVKVKGTVYTFATLDETVTYNIDMKASFNTDAEALVDGINTISGTVTLAADEKETVENAVVMLTSDAIATYDAETTGVNAIYVPSGATLKVTAACDAMIIAEADAAINIGTNGSLSNENNVLNGAQITNNNANCIAGEMDETTVVSAAYTASWPTTTIAANSRINSVTINLSAETTAQAPLAIEQAQIDIFKNLTDVTLTLGANIKNIQSVADVELTNLVSVTATSATWTTTNNAGIEVIAFQWGEEDTDVTTVDNIEAGTGVTLP